MLHNAIANYSAYTVITETCLSQSAEKNEMRRQDSQYIQLQESY